VVDWIYVLGVWWTWWLQKLHLCIHNPHGLSRKLTILPMAATWGHLLNALSAHTGQSFSPVNSHWMIVQNICWRQCSYRNIFQTSPPQSHLRRARCYPSWQRMHLSVACVSCAMSTADNSSCSDTGMLHQSLDTSVPNGNLYPNPNPTYHTNPTTTAS